MIIIARPTNVTTSFNTLVLPFFDYASVVWSNTDKSLTDSLVSLQARAGRIILGLPKLTPRDDVIRRMNWIPQRARWQCQRAILMYKVVKKEVPSYILDNFTSFSSTNRPNETERVKTRAVVSNDFIAPPCGREWGRRRFTAHGSHLWNGLPPEVKASKSVSSFKNSVQKIARNGFKFYEPLSI